MRAQHLLAIDRPHRGAQAERMRERKPSKFTRLTIWKVNSYPFVLELLRRY